MKIQVLEDLKALGVLGSGKNGKVNLEVKEEQDSKGDMVSPENIFDMEVGDILGSLNEMKRCLGECMLCMERLDSVVLKKIEFLKKMEVFNKTSVKGEDK